ncbi:Siderophore esteras-like protein IroE-like protein [Madurella fahalii]|uniref:Siderophore esteras-like protein IroE-like protein n=1 Tax=Madurella fahalii TaxID=1157608 RepID=A0ABQ0FYY6_9PEZI
MMTSLGDWTFTPYPPFPHTVFPNIALWNVSSVAKNMTYQVQVSWPFEWESRDVSDKTAVTMYVLDGNAMGMTAAEAWKRRVGLSFGQPDSVVVSIGYPLTDHVYSFAHRFSDYAPPFPTAQVPDPHGDEFVEFIGGTLRPWVRNALFPNVAFTRDALYGHSFGGLFVIYALISQPNMFDTYLSASPAIEWRNGSILDMVSDSLGTGLQGSSSFAARLRKSECISGNGTSNKPALMITYGSLEQFPVRRRTETEAEFRERKSYFQPLRMTEYCRELFDRVWASGRMRDVVIKEYVGQDHSGVAASAITDGIDYFVDW